MAMDRVAGHPLPDSRVRDRDHWSRIKTRIDRELAHWLPELADDVTAPSATPISRSLVAGKRVRGGLLCLVCDALGGEIDAALPRAAAIECVHLASLIHDDFIDGDRIRRDRPALWTVDGARRAVLLADMMFATAIREMVELSAADGAAIADAIARTARGAYLEFRGAHPPSDGRALDRYEQIIDLKTGTLFGAAARMGAIAASASPALRERASGFGTTLGAAYQIADDLIELTAHAAGTVGGNRHPGEIHAVVQHFATPESYDGGPPHDERCDAQTLGGERIDRCASAMRRAIASRLDAATAKLQRFPPGPPTARLRRMAVASIEMLLSGVS